MTFPGKINNDLLYRAPDGRECFVIFDGAGLAYIGQDITADRPRSVGFTADALRKIADRMDPTAAHVPDEPPTP